MKSSSNLPLGYLLDNASNKDTLEIINFTYFDHKLVLLSIYLLPLISYLLVFFLSNDRVLKLVMFGLYAATTLLGMTIYALAWFNIKTLLQLSKCWVIKYQNKIVGYAIVKKREPKYSELSNLYIKFSHRNQGLGSHLVRTLLKQVTQPIYVIPTPKALHFYIRLKFLPVPRHKLPKYYSQLSRQGMIVLRFISEE